MDCITRIKTPLSNRWLKLSNRSFIYKTKLKLFGPSWHILNLYTWNMKPLLAVAFSRCDIVENFSSIFRRVIFLINYNTLASNTILKFHFVDSAFESTRGKIWKRAAGVICFLLAIKKLKLIDIISVQHWQLLHWLVFN